MEIIVQLWPALRRGSTRLPLPTPCSLTRAKIKQLNNNNNYVVGVKNDGVRHMALLCFDDDTNYVKLFNRKGNETFQRLCQGEETIWNGTLLDVEVMPDHTWVLLDVVALDGYSYAQETFFDRLAKVTEEHVALLQQKMGITLVKKSWKPLTQLHTCDLSNACDGLIFMPTHLPVQVGRHNNMFKWKATHTIDLIWNGGSFCYMTRHGLQPITLPCSWDQALRDNVVYELKVEDTGCTVLMPRADKHIPNFETTVQDCVQCAMEKLSLEELRELVLQKI